MAISQCSIVLVFFCTAWTRSLQPIFLTRSQICFDISGQHYLAGGERDNGIGAKNNFFIKYYVLPLFYKAK